jgi:ABC-type glycerol-3-phosphate transport system substrate-binding protein
MLTLTKTVRTGALLATSSLLLTTVGSGAMVAQDGEWSGDYEGTTITAIAEATLNSTILKELLPDFTEKTGIMVELEEAPYDNLVQKATLDSSTGQGQFDVVSLPYEFLGAFAENGWLTALDDRLADVASYAPGFDPSAIIPALQGASAVWAGQTYGAPSNAAVMMMFYRTDLFEHPDEQAAFLEQYGYELGIPQTWAQYRDTAEFFDRSAGETLAGEVLAEDFYGVAMTGKRHVATVLEWMDYGWTFGGGILGSWTYTIPVGTDAADAAWLFIQWAMSDEVQAELGRRGGLPALTSVFENPELVANLPYWTQELVSLSEAKSRPRIPEWGAISDVLQEHISNAISGQTSAADAMAAAEADLQGILTLPVTER